MSVAIDVDRARLDLGGRTLWSDLSFRARPGELVAVLGANGAGKSSLLKALLGLVPFTGGRAELLGRPPRRGRREIGYLPQHRTFAVDAPLRARDLVRFGLDGHRYGVGGGRRARGEVDRLLSSVGATGYADERVGRLSGGEQQRIRIAQTLAGRPQVMLCDEPLQGLDLGYQRAVVDLIDRYRQQENGTVLFVTHDINPVMEVVDRVLYLFAGRYQWGRVDEVMNSASLSELYRSEVDVIRHDGRLLVLSGHSMGGHSVP